MSDDDPLLTAIVDAADRKIVTLHFVISVVRVVSAKLSSGEPGDPRAPVLATLRQALASRALVVGTLVDGELDAWHVSADDAIARIDAEWTALGRDPRPGEVAAFATIHALGYA